jgi:Tol biopolymer transport system component
MPLPRLRTTDEEQVGVDRVRFVDIHSGLCIGCGIGGLANGDPGTARASRRRRIAAGTALASLLALAVAVSASGAISAQLVSRNSNGVAANGDSGTNVGGGIISADGRFVVFDSNSTNLPGGSGTYYLTYLRDTATGKTSLMARDNQGDPASGAAILGGISADGNVVTFEGSGTGLPGADPNNTEVWIRDRSAGMTKLVSRTSSGDPADGGDSVEPTLSANGRFVVFDSDATNLPAGGVPRVYVRDVQTGKTSLASRTSNGRAAFGFLCGQSISADGSRVVWRSDDPKLPGANGFAHIYMRDLTAGTTSLIDRRTDGQTGTGGDADCPSISGNGRFVAFKSDATNLPGVVAPNSQQFLRDTKTNRLILVSRNSAGMPANGSALYGQPSGDGRYVTFEASATNLAGGSSSYAQVYARDLRRGRTILLSRTAAGDAGDADSSEASISQDGRFVAFRSLAANLGASPPNYGVFRSGPTH